MKAHIVKALNETRYYPFGLTMAGISSKAANSIASKQKFQEQEFAHNEFSDGSGLELYEFKWRTNDPQIGRFWQIDPLTDKYRYNSNYAFSENKVIAHREIEGLEAWTVNNPDGTTQTFSGPFANQTEAQRNYNLWSSKFGMQLDLNAEGMVLSPRVNNSRILIGGENGNIQGVKGIVLHRTAGGNVSGAVVEMQRRHLGVHFIIDKDGTITQLASLLKWCSHVGLLKSNIKGLGYSSQNTIGIEIVGKYYEESDSWESLTEAQVNSVAWLVNSLRRTYNLYVHNIVPHEQLSIKKKGEGSIPLNAIYPFLFFNQNSLSDAPKSSSKEEKDKLRAPLYF